MNPKYKPLLVLLLILVLMICGAIFNYNVKESDRIETESNKLDSQKIEQAPSTEAVTSNIPPNGSKEPVNLDQSTTSQATYTEQTAKTFAEAYAKEKVKDIEVNNPNDAIDESSMAHIQCQEFVKERLKAPSSADFPFLDFRASKLANSQYIIRSYVDAQNAFGAKLRSNYTCVVKWNGSDHSDIRNWELVSMQIDE